MKKFYFLLVLFITISAGKLNAKEIHITDINNHWAKESIIRMLTNEKVNGYPDDTFKPDNPITVLEFIKMIMENFNIKILQEGLNKWPDNYIATAKKYDMNYEYDTLLTRYQAIEIISKLIDLKSISTSSKKFKDVESIYQSNLSKLYKLRIINGYQDSTFRGKNNISRAEAVTMILRALEANQRIIQNKKYTINSEYTNINREDADKSEIKKIRYEIYDNKIYFYDKGRFSNIDGYTIQENHVTNQKLIKIIQSLVSQSSYTAVYYVPSPYIINQIIIQYGENDNLVNHNLDYFSIVYYEDKLYDLNRIALNDEFSNECYMKITLKKLWQELYQLENGIYVDENIKTKLLKTLKVEFGNSANDILNYMIEKYEISTTLNEPIADQIEIGNVMINTYKTDATSLEFYFEKLSS